MGALPEHLPNAGKARVDESKIKEYLLSRSHPDGRAKAEFFLRLGFSTERWEQLAAALRTVALSNPVRAVAHSVYGVRYTDRISADRNDMKPIREHDRVVLVNDLPDERLAAGDVGTVVHIHEGGKAFEVEFVALDGETVAIVTLERSQVRPVAQREITHARRVA